MKKKILIFFLIIFFCIPFIKAQTTYLNLNVYVQNDGSCVVVGSSSFDPEISEIEFDKGTIYGITQKLTNKKAELWTFNLNIEKIYDTANIKIVLLENSKIVGPIESDSTITLESEGDFININIAETRRPIKVSFNYELSQSQKKKNFVWLYILIIAIIIFLIIFLKKGLFKKKTKKESKKIVKKETKFEKNLRAVRKTLNDRENKIIEMLLKFNGKTQQGKLQKLCGIPKASFSRHIQELERKNLIIKHGKGKINLIEINKKFWSKEF